MKAICLIGTKYETSGGGEEAAEEGGEWLGALISTWYASKTIRMIKTLLFK